MELFCVYWDLPDAYMSFYLYGRRPWVVRIPIEVRSSACLFCSCRPVPTWVGSICYRDTSQLRIVSPKAGWSWVLPLRSRDILSYYCRYSTLASAPLGPNTSVVMAHLMFLYIFFLPRLPDQLEVFKSPTFPLFRPITCTASRLSYFLATSAYPPKFCGHTKRF